MTGASLSSASRPVSGAASAPPSMSLRMGCCMDRTSWSLPVERPHRGVSPDCVDRSAPGSISLPPLSDGDAASAVASLPLHPAQGSQPIGSPTPVGFASGPRLWASTARERSTRQQVVTQPLNVNANHANCERSRAWRYMVPPRPGAARPEGHGDSTHRPRRTGAHRTNVHPRITTALIAVTLLALFGFSAPQVAVAQSVPSACSDGIDNDGDGWIDEDDDACRYEPNSVDERLRNLPTLKRRDAISFVRFSLRSKFEDVYDAAHAKRYRCSRVSRTRFNCRPSFRWAGWWYHGTFKVWDDARH
jgi:hypothetical protein